MAFRDDRQIARCARALLVPLGRLLAVLDADRLADLGALLVALGQGPDAVDRWLAAREGVA